MALGCGLTSVRDIRGKNYEKELLVRQKHIKKKKVSPRLSMVNLHYDSMVSLHESTMTPG
jgi:hypothetical protein